MTASFDSAAFGQMGGGQFAVWSKAGSIAIKKIPGGSKNVIQKVGVGLPRLALPIKATAAQLTALYAKVGVSGTLIFGYESATAMLESIDGVAEQSAGRNVYFATLNLIRLASLGTTSGTSILTEGGDAILTEGGDYLIME